jgi:hypothetical protein
VFGDANLGGSDKRIRAWWSVRSTFQSSRRQKELEGESEMIESQLSFRYQEIYVPEFVSRKERKWRSFRAVTWLGTTLG